MALGVDIVSGVPGVYRQVAERGAGFPRLRTDVAGFVGVAGPRRLGEVVRIDDWRSYEHRFLRDDRSRPIAAPAGAQLARCVRAYFANGGARCWIANVGAGIELDDADGLRDRMLGVDGRTGLEALLAIREVAIVGLPELDAEVVDERRYSLELAQSGRFASCPSLRIVDVAEAIATPVRRVYDDAAVLDLQRHVITRCARDRWRVFAVLTTPPGRSAAQAARWKASLTAGLGPADGAALYWPWVVAQDVPGADTAVRSPLGYVCGVFARRDLARGPHAAPANEALVGVVGVERTCDDEEHGAVYAAGVNVLRPSGTAGIELWGARTLLHPSADGDPLAFVNVRRCLSAIERTCDLIGQTVVFEPNQPLLRFQLAQAIVGYLLDVHARGALAGVTAEDSFFVRSDETNNPRAWVDQGWLTCDVGVAIAAPAEFIVFRVGRHEGVVEIEEQP